MLLALVSGKGSPGATAAALALTFAWRSPVLLAETDARGGDIRCGYGQGVQVGARGLLDWHAAGVSASSLWPQVLSLETGVAGPGRWWLPGLERPRQAGSIDWSAVAAVVAGLTGVDVIADCGCVVAPHVAVPVWQAADLTVVVVRASLPGVVAARAAIEQVRQDLMSGGMGPERLVALVVGAGSVAAPYSVAEVAGVLAEVEVPVVAHVPWDDKGALMLAGVRPAGRKDPRLVVGAREAAARLHGRAEQLGSSGVVARSAAGVSGGVVGRHAVSPPSGVSGQGLRTVGSAIPPVPPPAAGGTL